MIASRAASIRQPSTQSSPEAETSARAAPTFERSSARRASPRPLGADSDAATRRWWLPLPSSSSPSSSPPGYPSEHSSTSSALTKREALLGHPRGKSRARTAGGERESTERIEVEEGGVAEVFFSSPFSSLSSSSILSSTIP